MLTCYLVTTFFFTSHFYVVYGFVCHSLYPRYVFAIGTYLHRITSHRKWELQGTYIGATWDLPFSRSGSTCRANRQIHDSLLLKIYIEFLCTIENFYLPLQHKKYRT